MTKYKRRFADNENEKNDDDKRDDTPVILDRVFKLPRHIVPKQEKDWPEFVEYCAGIGLTNAQIGDLLDLKEEAFKKRFDRSVRRGQAIAAFVIAGRCFMAAQKRDTPRIFWLKATQKWVDQHKPEDSGSKQPIQIAVQIVSKTKEIDA